MTGAERICRSLEALGVDTVFGLPGSQNVALFEALRTSRLQTIVAMHELGASFMANGYARASGRPGVLMTIPGPGFTYALTGLAEALLDSAHKRARPIIMTTVAMGAGMTPIAMGLGTGVEFREPMAVAVIGGLITSTVLSLLFVPVVFGIVDRANNWLRKTFGGFTPEGKREMDEAQAGHQPAE